MKGLVILSGVFILAAGLCIAAPKPAAASRPGEWTVDVTFENIHSIEVKLPSQDKPSQFWYIILTLTNKSGQDVDFYPQCELVTDTFQITPAGSGVTEEVFKQIKMLYQPRYPFLEWVEKADPKILQGKDNARDIAIIWQDFDTDAKAIELFIGGLSNETAVIDHPTAKDANGKPLKVYLRKTLQLSYELPGDPAFRSQTTPKLAGQDWVMR